MTDAERIHELEDRVAEYEGRVAELEASLADAEDEVSEAQDGAIRETPSPMDLLVEVECRRCHHRFRSLPDVAWCSRDCENGWTRPESFDDYYLRMHPARRLARFQLGEPDWITVDPRPTNTDPVLR